MRIDISRLGPDAQRQILGKVLAVRAEENKYHNRKAVRMMPNGKLRRFDSQKEARRYDQLAAMLRAGKIRDLRLQHTFTLQESFVSSNGDAVRAITYKADFVYTLESGEKIVEDAKGVRTETYKIKKKLMEERGYQVREV